jgi:1-pyrroline-5-carboxylate dehydrogenase
MASGSDIEEYLESAKRCPKSGMHNPIKNPERYLMWGDIMFKIA